MPNVHYSFGSMSDIDEMEHLVSTWWNDSSFYKNTSLPMKIDRELLYNIANDDKLIIVIGKHNDSIISCYIGVQSPYLLNTDMQVSTEIVWCVHKDYRSLREMSNLIKAIEMSMKVKGIDLYGLSLPIGDGNTSLAKYLTKKKGFFIQDMNIMKRIQHNV